MNKGSTINGSLSKRFGKRPVLILSAIAFTIGCILFTTAYFAEIESLVGFLLLFLLKLFSDGSWAVDLLSHWLLLWMVRRRIQHSTLRNVQLVFLFQR